MGGEGITQNRAVPVTGAGVRPILELHSREKMAAILQRERARTNRTGRPFSVVVFEILIDANLPKAQRLGRVVLDRARITDEIGWHDDYSIAAVLSETPLEGALVFARDISRRVDWHIGAIQPTVYTYPTDEPGAEEAVEPPAGDVAARDQTAGEKNAVGSRRGTDYAVTKREAVDVALPLECLLARPLPRWKRGLDIVGAAVGLVVCAPVMAAAAVAIKLTSPGPVLFAQLRTGRGCQPFRMYKLRTMRQDAEKLKASLLSRSEQDGPAFKMHHDPRVTRVGKFLRRSSIDELPQLWNVLRGEMSLVGPRPLPYQEAARCRSWHRLRHDVLPGLTCIWQVYGRSRVPFEVWMRMDLQYIRSMGLLKDLALLLRTIGAVVRTKGAC